MILATNKMLVAATVRIDEEMVIKLVLQSLEQGVDPNTIMSEMRIGLEMVLKMYSEGTYFLADLLIASEVFKQVHEMVLAHYQSFDGNRPIDVVFGTVQRDIHDIGKSIAISVMQSIGLNVVDMGVDVRPQQFVEMIQKTGAPILCLTGLLTISYDYMKATIHLLGEIGLREGTTVFIGGLVNDSVQSYVGSDYWVYDLQKACEMCKTVLMEKSRKKINIS